MANEVPIKTSKKSPKMAAQNNKTNQASKTTSNDPAEKVTKPRPFFIIPSLSLVMATIALVSGLYAAFTSQQLYQTQGQQTQALSNEINALKQQQLEEKTTVAAATQTLNHAQEKMHDRLQELNKNLQIAMQQHLYQKQDWILLKARYYLELAQINGYWSRDQQATIALLQQADELLVTISNQQLFAIRQAIAREITQLQALPKVDIAGLLSQLDAAQSIISDLPVKQAFNPSVADSTNNTDQPTSTWRKKLHDSMHVLEKLVIVHHNDDPINSLPPPIYQAILRESIHLNLQEAQWALLQNNPQVYQLALNQAINDVKRTFETKAESTQVLLKQLQHLKQENLIIPKLVIKDSLTLLNELIGSNSQKIQATVSKGEKAP